MRYEVIEIKGAQRIVHLQTDDRFEAQAEFRWLEDRKEQHDASMGTIRIVQR